MGDPETVQEAVSAQAAPPEQRLRLIRVKRKRGSEAPEDLVVEGLAAPGKRAHTSLSNAMAGLGLEQPAEGTEDEQSRAAEGPAVRARRAQRYRKLSTLSAAQLRSIDQQQLQDLLAAGRQQQEEQQPGRQHRSGIKSGAGTGAEGGAAQRAAQQLQAGQAARYEHIKRRRGISAFTITEQSPDPLQQLAAVYDVVRHEPAQGTAPQSAAGQAGAGVSEPRQQRRDGRRPDRAQRAAQQYDEGTLLCNYMPMIREYLQSQGRDLPDPLQQRAAEAAGAETQQQAGGDAAAAGMEEDGGSGSDGEYVYDLYAAVDEQAAGEGSEEESWWEVHASGHAPVVQILDDDTWVVLEQSDADDSDADTEDSNAEGFYAHDYPEEASDYDSSDDDGYDPEGDVFSGGRRHQRGWDSESYGSQDGYD